MKSSFSCSICARAKPISPQSCSEKQNFLEVAKTSKSCFKGHELLSTIGTGLMVSMQKGNCSGIKIGRTVSMPNSFTVKSVIVEEMLYLDHLNCYLTLIVGQTRKLTSNMSGQLKSNVADLESFFKVIDFIAIETVEYKKNTKEVTSFHDSQGVKKLL